ncbi:MAG: hypothetical protein NC110_00545 [Ruminococcus sp.]|nr:hypothetical protein [Ruminococcus sp.]
MNFDNFKTVGKQLALFIERVYGWLFYVLKVTDDPFLLDPIYNAAFPHG